MHRTLLTAMIPASIVWLLAAAYTPSVEATPEALSKCMSATYDPPEIVVPSHAYRDLPLAPDGWRNRLAGPLSSMGRRVFSISQGAQELKLATQWRNVETGTWTVALGRVFPDVNGAPVLAPNAFVACTIWQKQFMDANAMFAVRRRARAWR